MKPIRLFCFLMASLFLSSCGAGDLPDAGLDPTGSVSTAVTTTVSELPEEDRPPMVSYAELPSPDEDDETIASLIADQHIEEYENPESARYFEVDVTSLEAMPVFARPKGYRDPVLTARTAYQLLREDSWVYRYFVSVGCAVEDFRILNRWLAENAIDPAYNSSYAYFVPPLDTEEEFTEFFSRYFCGETLPIARAWCSIREMEDGRLAGTDYSAYHNATDWDCSYVSSVAENDDGTVTVLLARYLPDALFNGYTAYTFAYDEEYGWRAEFDYGNMIY